MRRLNPKTKRVNRDHKTKRMNRSHKKKRVIRGHIWRNKQMMIIRYFEQIQVLNHRFTDCFFLLHYCKNNFIVMPILLVYECMVACMDKSYSEHVLCTYLTPNPTNWALYLSQAVQIRFQTILSFIQSYKI